MRRLAEQERALTESFKFIPDGPDWELRCYDQVGSTMDLALSEIEQAANPQACILVSSQHQTAGRGRRGSKWESAQSGVYATFAFPTRANLGELSGLSLACGCALKRSLSELGLDVGLKWPNDVLSGDGRKLAGILIELAGRGEYHYALIGIGINLSGVPLSQTEAVALDQIGAFQPSSVEVLESLTRALYAVWFEFLQSGFKVFRDEWLAAALYLNEELSVENGQESLQGYFRGVCEQGRLLLETSQGMREIVSGHTIRRSNRQC